MRGFLTQLILALFLLFCFKDVNATTYYVNDAFTTGDIFCSAIGNNTNSGLSPALPKASLSNLWSTYSSVIVSGDIIKIDAGTYTNDININVTKSGVTFEGASLSATVFDNNLAAVHTNYFMYIGASNVTLKNFTIREYENNGTQTPVGRSGQALTIGGSASTFSGILLENIGLLENGESGGNPTISVQSRSSVTITGGGSFCNTAGTAYTGGVEAYGVNINLVIQNTVIASNYKDSGFDGGGIRIEGDGTTNVTLKNSRIEGNVATSGGAISQLNGVLTVSDCIFYNNKAGQVSSTVYGGAVRISAGTARFTRCKFQNNTKTAGTLRGGAIGARYLATGGFSSSKTISLTIDSCTFQSNSADLGNDVYAANGSGNTCTVVMRDCKFLTGGNFNLVSDGTSPVTSLTVTYFGTVPTHSGTNITKSLSTNATYTASPAPPSFSGLCGGTIAILPIEFIDFQGECKFNKQEFVWGTASEQNNDYFAIYQIRQHHSDELIGVIDAVGHSVSKEEYKFEVYGALSEIAYYKLVQTDINGHTTPLKTISIPPCIEPSIFFDAAQKQLILASGFDGDLEVRIYDSAGRMMHVQSFENAQNHINVDFLVDSGIYIAMISNGKESKQTRFILN